MSDNNLIEHLEFDQALLAELAAGGNNFTALIEFLKENKTCDFSGFDTFLRDPRVVEAAAFLREKSTPSQYRRRLTSRAYLNTDDLASSQVLWRQGGTPWTADLSTSSKVLTFPVLTGDSEDLFTTDTPINSALTIKTAGAYKLSFNGLMASVPNATDTTSIALPTSVTHRFLSAAGAPTKIPVELVLRVETTTQTTYSTLATAFVYASDFAKMRTRYIAGSTLLRLHSASRISLHLQRMGSMGQYVNNTTSQTHAEALGFTKLITTIPGSVAPTRDNHNYLEITRLT